MARSMWLPGISLLLAACTAPTTAPAARQATTPSTPPPEAPAVPKPAPVAAANGSEVAVESLPQDVRDYILKQRMCRHFRNGGNTGNAALADALCAGGDAAKWRSLIRKYQSDDTIGSVLLAEKPFDAPETSP